MRRKTRLHTEQEDASVAAENATLDQARAQQEVRRQQHPAQGSQHRYGVCLKQ